MTSAWRSVAKWMALSIAVAGLAVGTPAAADEAAGEPLPTIVFNHATDGPSASYALRLKAKASFVVEVTNTATNCFDYEVEKVQRRAGPQGRIEGDVGDTTKKISIRHEETYGGYIVHIRAQHDRPSACDGDDYADLKDATIIVAVETIGIEVAFGGGFTVSELTDPRFAVRTENGTDVVVRDESAEDDYSLGVGAFIHVYGKDWSKWAPAVTFGLGINDSNEATYFVGPFWRLGDQAFLGGGVVFGSVDRLPSGIEVGDEVTDPNVLTDLPSRTNAAAFIGFSYTFLGNKAAFQKPFKSLDEPAAAGVSSAAAGNAGPGKEKLKAAQDAANAELKKLAGEGGPLLEVALTYDPSTQGVLYTKTQKGSGVLSADLKNPAKVTGIIASALEAQGIPAPVKER